LDSRAWAVGAAANAPTEAAKKARRLIDMIQLRYVGHMAGLAA